MCSKRADAPAAPSRHPWAHPMRVAALGRGAPTRFDLKADAAERLEVAAWLDLLELSTLRFRGELAPDGDGWMLTGRLTADLAQECVATLEPVPARIDQRVVRGFVPDTGAASVDLDPDADDEPDTFTDVIDPGAVALEELALSLDPYPHAAGAAPVAAQAAPPGTDALDDAAARPFAGLAALRDKLQGS